MFSEDVAVRVSHLRKCYEIYESPRDRLRQFIWPRFQRFSRLARTQYFREFWALKDVSFEIRRGETVAIVGKNGSGKSTLLQIICGTLNPSGGEVQLNGRVAALLELGSGFNPEFSGRENVYMNAGVLGLSRQEIDAKLTQILEFADIGEFIDQPVKTYSSGMYVRLAFAVAIHVDPDILIVDEALSVGDIRFQSKCLHAIEGIKQRGAAVLFVTHSPGQVEALCSRAIWLNDGVVKADESPKTLMRRYINFMTHGLDDAAPQDAASEDTALLRVQDAAQQSLAPEWVDLRNSAHRSGTLTAVIDRIKVLGPDGKSWHVADSDVQSIKVVLSIFANERISMPLLAIGVFNALNEPMVHFNSENVGASLPVLVPGARREFTATFDLPALKPGEYLISVGLDDGVSGQSVVVCHVYDAWPFTVAMPSRRKVQGGYFQISGSASTIVQNPSAEHEAVPA
jgi:lipopolysaccharide transport system ATP-binding protein